MPIPIRFTIPGRPQQRGSKTAIKRRDGTLVLNKSGHPVLRDSNSNSLAWMQVAKRYAAGAYKGDLLRGPVRLSTVFYFVRPKCHYGSGANAAVLKGTAPVSHTGFPDLDKLVRCLADSLTGVIWVDDSQVCDLIAEKRWTEARARTDVQILSLKNVNQKELF